MKTVSRADLALAYRRLFSTEEGQVVLGHLVQKFGYVNKSTFSESHADMARREGHRQVLQHLNWQMTVDIDTLAQSEIAHEETSDDHPTF